jgi:hypothetical protein
MNNEWDLNNGVPPNIKFIGEIYIGGGADKDIWATTFPQIYVGKLKNMNSNLDLYFLREESYMSSYFKDLQNLRNLRELYPKLDYPIHIPYSDRSNMQSYTLIQRYGKTLAELSGTSIKEQITIVHISKFYANLALLIDHRGVPCDNTLTNVTFDEINGLRLIDFGVYNFINSENEFQTLIRRIFYKINPFCFLEMIKNTNFRLGIKKEISQKLILAIIKNKDIYSLCKKSTLKITHEEKLKLFQFFSKLGQ